MVPIVLLLVAMVFAFMLIHGSDDTRTRGVSLRDYRCTSGSKSSSYFL